MTATKKYLSLEEKMRLKVIKCHTYCNTQRKKGWYVPSNQQGVKIEISPPYPWEYGGRYCETNEIKVLYNPLHYAIVEADTVLRFFGDDKSERDLLRSFRPGEARLYFQLMTRI
jgi:hypothetical protein